MTADIVQPVRLGNVMVDCDDEQKLQAFYSALLGWEACVLFARPAVRSPEGIVFLFIEEPGYVRPVWPERPGVQQKQMHFDFQVKDIEQAARQAESLGAVRTPEQFGGDEFVTLLDLAGHPFCLSRA